MKLQSLGAKQSLINTEDLLTVQEAAALKGVSSAAIYNAIVEKRLPAVRVLNRIALRVADVESYQPTRYAGRAGAKGRGGRPKGMRVAAETKRRISEAQKRRWDARKAQTQAL